MPSSRLSPKSLLSLVLCCSTLFADAQNPDTIYYPPIRSPQLFAYGNQLGYPIIRLNSGDRLELQFDDLDADVKNLSYTYVLCNADWTPAQLTEFDYIRGFSQARIPGYKFSSMGLTRYTHYHAVIPDPNCVPIRSGNYLLKVFADGDTSRLAFTRRFLVAEDGVTIGAQILLPFGPDLSRTHQKLQFTINMRGLNISSPTQQIKVVILQNHRWDIARRNIRPTFYSGNNMQFTSDDDYNFAAGKEWRWLDIQSLRYHSDRIQRVNTSKTSTDVYLVPDADRSRQPYYFYKDYDGQYFIQTTESVNPNWQTDYATVHFSFVPPGNSPFPDKDVYLLGQMTDYSLSDSTKMRFNAEHGVYETAQFLKQGFYNYSYVTVNATDPDRIPSFDFTEGNNQETENDYLILVYYRDLTGRADQLVGMADLNTLNGRGQP